MELPGVEPATSWSVVRHTDPWTNEAVDGIITVYNFICSLKETRRKILKWQLFDPEYRNLITDWISRITSTWVRIVILKEEIRKIMKIQGQLNEKWELPQRWDILFYCNARMSSGALWSYSQPGCHGNETFIRFHIVVYLRDVFHQACGTVTCGTNVKGYVRVLSSHSFVCFYFVIFLLCFLCFDFLLLLSALCVLWHIVV